MAELYKIEHTVSEYSSNVNNNFPDFARSIINFVSTERQLTDETNPMELLVDAGCGSGGSTRIFAPFFKRIIGVDPSEEQIAAAKSDTNCDNIEYMLGSGENIPVEKETVDVIISYFAIQYMNLEKYVAECRRVLKHDGLALSFGHDYNNIEPLDSGDSKPVQDILKTFFEAAKIFFTNNRPDLGCWLDRYQSIFDNIDGINKKRVDDICHRQEMRLIDFKLRLLSIPEYRSYDEAVHLKTGKHPVDELILDIKRRWEFSQLPDEEIRIRMTYSFFVICLRK